MKNIQTLFGTKKEMSQTFVGDTRVPVTVVEVKSNVVTQIKTEKKDGYWAVQLGSGEKKLKNTTKPIKGHLKGVIKDKEMAPLFLREARVTKEPTAKIADKLNIADVFSKGDVVRVTGVSKGKGFAGVMKRHGFAGGPRTHGQSDRPRSPGSIGQGTTPGRVRKGKKMPGRMGSDTITITGLRVVDIDEEKTLLTISGSVPGPFGGLVQITKIRSGKLESLEVEAVEIVKQEEAKEEETKEKESEE